MMAEEEPLVSDEESGCCSEESDSDGTRTPPIWRPRITTSERLHLAAAGAAVAASSCALVVTLPLLAAPAVTNGPCPLLPAALAACLLLWPLALFARLRRRRPRPPVAAVVRPGVLQGTAAAALVAAVQGDRVLCHLQVPLLGSGVVFAIAVYFLVCKKVVSLKRIFGGMVVILGIFVSVDYQLCNEFRCRGREVAAAQLRGSFWTWGGHLAWAAIYVVAVGLWVFASALLENHFVRVQARTSPLMVSTVERLAASRGDLHAPAEPVVKLPAGGGHFGGGKHWSHSLEAAAVLAATQLVTAGLFAGISALALSQKEASLSEWWRNLGSCLWLQLTSSWGSWTLSCSYALFLFATCHFLSLTESALFTHAAAAVALPASGAFWSLFASSTEDNDLRLRPSLTGDLMCALLGLPVMLAGLSMLVRSHWAEQRRLKLIHQ